MTAIEGASGWRGVFSIAIAGTLLAVSLARLLSDPNRDTAASWPGLRSIYDAYRPLVRDLRMVAVFLGIIGRRHGCDRRRHLHRVLFRRRIRNVDR
ncbi:MAG: hypothetical protein R2849_00725 [Thermomicrobiales bacterium]